MSYADGYVLPVPKKHLKIYRSIAQKAGKIWRKHGALEYRECAGDDLAPKYGMPFTKAVKAKSSETVIFSWVVFKSRAHRDSVNSKVFNDPDLKKIMDNSPMPFDMERMAYGGFKPIVEIKA